MAIEPVTCSPIASKQVAISVADLLLRAAEQHSTSGIKVASRTTDAELLSYPALLQEARRILGGLQAQWAKVNRGANIVLLLEDPRDFIPAFWACVLGGYVPCPLAPIRGDAERWARHLSHVDTLLNHPLFISRGELLHDLPAFVASTDVANLRTSPPQGHIYRADPSDLAILMLTSGSTGNSKAVELTHGNLLASMAGRAGRQQVTDADIMFNWIAFDHVAALLESHMIALYCGAMQLHAEPAVILSDPLQFLRLIDCHRVTIAFAPNFLLGQVNSSLQAANAHPIESQSSVLDLTSLRRIVTGGEANVVDTGVRFLELLAPYGLRRDVLWPAFGMTETCAASVYSSEFPDCDTKREFAAVGLPIKDLKIRIVDDRGRACAPGESGELQVSGPMIFRRYYGNEEATLATFTADGWFRTGDVGRIDDERLCLLARNKDSIIVNGVNYFSHELETRLEQLDGIEKSFVAAFPTRPKSADTEELVAVFATTLPAVDEEHMYQLVVAIRNTTIMLWGFRPALILQLPKSAFPKTSLGKIQRSLLRKRLEGGELDSYVDNIADITRQQVGPFIPPEGPLETTIASIFCEILRTDASVVSVAASFFDLGGTSLDILKLTQSLERRCGSRVGLPVVLQNPSIRQLAQHISSSERPSSRQYDPIVPLQTTGRKAPLFCVHPGNGEVFVLVNVAKYFLNERPFYALRPRGFNEGEKPFTTMTEMVNTYVDAILRRQSQGPYAIAGYSLGCAIAFEVAKEIQARGHEIAFLGCIDTWPLHLGQPLNFNMATGLAMVTDLITQEQFAQLNKELRPDLPSDEVCEYVLKFASPERLAELDLDLPRFSTWARVAHCIETMLFTHLTSGKTQKMTIFCSEGISPRYTALRWTRQTWRAELNRWSQFVEHPKYVEIPGTHHALMGPKYVATFQAVLRAEIDLAFSEA